MGAGIAKAIAAAAAVLALTGCTSSDNPGGPATTAAGVSESTPPSGSTAASETTGPTTAAPSTSHPSATIPPPTSAAPTSAAPANSSPTATLETRNGPCPYLDAEFVKDTIGQHLGRTTYTTATPSICTFYRSDGGWGATVTPTHAASANDAARQAVSIPGANAEPVDLPTGGAVSIIKDGAILATSRGTLLLVVKINQQSPLEATLIAEQALKGL